MKTVFIRLDSGKVLSIQVKNSTKIKEVKKQISAAEQIPKSSLSLIYNNSQLKDT
jgi:hypothetical protein